MITLSNKLRLVKPGVYAHWCPACDKPHQFNEFADDDPEHRGCKFYFNGNWFAPSFGPDMNIESATVPETRCRYYLTRGVLEFRSDSTHALAGQVIPLPDWPVHTRC
ncbi:hypothetical protein ACFPOE_11300 [Caenimonas terrae]|uniref:Ammonia monooxygenase n=1 Tax=Caenimonas terrae TaxID=696074 RepID=A0ABW0NGI2_9BURK